VVATWRLDRLGRSLRHVIDTVRLLEHRGVGALLVAADILGNDPTVLAKIYAHLYNSDRRAAVDGLGIRLAPMDGLRAQQL
jgi:hypothetical protein